MRQLAFITCVAALSGAIPALAEPVVLRVEAKRGAGTQAAVDGWAGRFAGVVTFPLQGGWTGIGIGPMDRPAAEAELARLKAARQVPQDSFIAPVPEGAVPAAKGGAAAPAAEGAAATNATPAAGKDNPGAAASTFAGPGASDRTPGDDAADAAPAAVSTDTAPAAAVADPATDTAAPAAAAVVAPGEAAAGEAGTADPAAETAAGTHIRLQRFDTRAAADEALARWRTDFPEAGLYQQPDGSFAVTLGPLPRETAEAWLAAFRAAERAGKPAGVVAAADLGTALDAGRPIDLPAAGSAEMPPLAEVQSALRWAGRYDGKVDGKDGPATRGAIAAEVLALRAAPDAPSAMQALIARRAEWRGQMGLTRLDDPQSGLSVIAPMDRLAFERNDQGLSIYGPRDDSGAALILYSAPGGQQEMLDFTGLVTALGWVPAPERKIEAGHASLKGRNETHIGQAEARVVDGRVEAMVLIWPVMDEADQPRVAAEMIESLARTPADRLALPEVQPADPATAARGAGEASPGTVPAADDATGDDAAGSTDAPR